MIEAEHIMLALVVAAVTILVSTCTSDQSILRNCATKGEAPLMSGGTIECVVKKESK